MTEAEVETNDRSFHLDKLERLVKAVPVGWELP